MAVKPLGIVDRLFPASAGLSALVFPFVDRDGLSKPLLQIIAEDALESGIETIGVVATPTAQAQIRIMLDHWRGPAGLPDDWVRLEQEKLATLAAAIRFIDAPTIRDPTEYFTRDCRDFVAGEPCAFLPADVLYVSGTKDRCLQQLLIAASDQDVDGALAVRPILAREAFDATVVRADTHDRLSPIAQIVEKPALDQIPELYTPGLPPGQLLAATGMCLLSAAWFENRPAHSSLPADQRLADPGKTCAVHIDAACFDLQSPYGLLEAQLGLGLSGIHRVEICEMIARTLAEQAKN